MTAQDISILVLGKSEPVGHFLSYLPTQFKPFVCKPSQPLDAAIQAYRPRLVVDIQENDATKNCSLVEEQAFPLNVVRFRFDSQNKLSPVDIERTLHAGIQKSAISTFPIQLDPLVGNSQPMILLKQRLVKFASNSAPVVLLGENGTGKDLCAHSIHKLSDRAHKPFVAVNCGAITETLAESEFFGCIKGAFTGAETRIGYFQEADGGTLFLDEIGDLSLALQVKLLRVLENKEVRRVGSTQAETVQFRLICATNKDLKKLVSQGRFREDLYFRIYVLPAWVPALRDRGSDIVKIARHFLQTIDPCANLLPSAEKAIAEYRWPGNVRQLKNVLQRSLLLANSKSLSAPDIDLDCEEFFNRSAGYEEL